jgi:hypothetical protein
MTAMVARAYDSPVPSCAAGGQLSTGLLLVHRPRRSRRQQPSRSGSILALLWEASTSSLAVGERALAVNRHKLGDESTLDILRVVARCWPPGDKQQVRAS